MSGEEEKIKDTFSEEMFFLLSGAALLIAVAVVLLFFVFITRKNKLITEHCAHR